MKVEKGAFGYIEHQRRRVILRTAGLFALSLAVYAIGYATTKTNKNLLTIVAVLGCLPACKSVVNLIMFLKARGCDGQVREKIEACMGSLAGAYDLVFTTYEKTYPVCHMVFRGKSVCGYTQDPKCDASRCGEYLEKMYQQNGCRNVTVKIFTDMEKYTERLRQLGRLGGQGSGAEDDQAADSGQDLTLRHLALTVSL